MNIWLYDFMIYNLHQYFCSLQKIFTPFRKKHNGNKNNKKTFSIKMKEDVGMSKPKKKANKIAIVLIKQTTYI